MDQNQRPEYYEGQYLGAQDLAAIVRFARTLEARHALGAHLWGIGIGLELVERPLPSGDVEITLTPGYACDGVGRSLVALAPTRIGLTRFENFQDTTDLLGIPLEIWIAYHELPARRPGEGFASCREDEPFARVIESFNIEIRRPPVTEYRGVVVAGRTIDAKVAISAFKPGVAALYDETVAYQELPDKGDKPRWALFIGIVRWVKAANQSGRLIKRTDDDLNATRRGRRYLGAVAETILAPGGVLRLRDRNKDPDDSTINFQTPVPKPPPGVVSDNDLVWVEGNLRVIGDARLVAGKLDYRVEGGGNDSVPMWLRRIKDTSTPTHKVTLEAAIGPPTLLDSQTRFAVSTLMPTGTSVERLTVITDINKPRVGVNAPEPQTALHVTGDRIRLGDIAKQHIDLRVDGDAVDLHTTTHNLWIRTEGTPGSPLRHVFINPNNLTEGNVGIGTSGPTHKLDVDGDLRVRGNAWKDTIGVWWLPSDLTLKKDVSPVSDALRNLLRLKGVEFSWREPERHGATAGRYTGFIAQDVEKVFPQWVMTMDSGVKALNPIGLEALMVEALRELNAKCERLESELRSLRKNAPYRKTRDNPGTAAEGHEARDAAPENRPRRRRESKK